jgi:hypothetical protein
VELEQRGVIVTLEGKPIAAETPELAEVAS